MRVALFVTCLVDFYRPSIGFAAIRLLEKHGCVVEVPPLQVCCGQPAYNAGDRADAKKIAAQVIAAFDGYEHVVVPSGSCGGMISQHYPDLFADEPAMAQRAQHLAKRTHELVSFLTDILHVERVDAEWPGTATYHDGCSGLRELGIKEQPRRLLRAMSVPVVEMAEPEICCGFGGTFCVKYPEISVRMASDKTRDITGTGAGTVLAGDLGCLLNIAGRLSREGSPVRARHVAEVLAGMTGEVAPIGQPRQKP
jgi:L-lactate dehydrogenase complex protein LldE